MRPFETASSPRRPASGGRGEAPRKAQLGDGAGGEGAPVLRVQRTAAAAGWREDVGCASLLGWWHHHPSHAAPLPPSGKRGASIVARLRRISHHRNLPQAAQVLLVQEPAHLPGEVDLQGWPHGPGRSMAMGVASQASVLAAVRSERRTQRSERTAALCGCVCGALGAGFRACKLGVRLGLQRAHGYWAPPRATSTSPPLRVDL